MAGYKTNYKSEIFTPLTASGMILSGIFFTLMQPFVLFGLKMPDMGFLAWVYLVPLLMVMHPYNLKKKILIAFLSGCIGHFGMLYWLMNALQQFGQLSFIQAFGLVILLIIIMSLKHALFLGLAMWSGQVARLPLALVLFTFMLGHNDFIHHHVLGGFPWGVPAYSQGEWLRFFQWVDHTGIMGLSAYIYIVNGLLAEGMILTFFKKQIDKLMSRAVVVLVLALLSLYASFLAKQNFEKSKKSYGQMQVALIQGNILQNLKWDPKKAKENLQRYIKMTVQAYKNGAELVIWPETAYPFGLAEESFQSEHFLDQEKIQAPLFTGAMTTQISPDGDKKLFNSVVHVNTDARITGVYHKIHLVPVGEFVPFKSILGKYKKLTYGMGDFTRGEEYSLFKIGDINFGSLICFEDVFYDVAREFAKKGAHVLVNYTNDAWYGQSSALYQHLVYSQFRALENRRTLLRATNTGITAMIGPSGDIIQDLPPFKEGTLLQSLKYEGYDSPFLRLGDSWVSFVEVAASLMLFFALVKWKFGPVKIDL